MAYLSGIDCSRLMLLAEAIEDYFAPGDPLRFMEAFVSGIDARAVKGCRLQGQVSGAITA